jgi:hypothetical protein
LPSAYLFYTKQITFFINFADIQEYYETLLTFVDEAKPLDEIEMESREVAKKWENIPSTYNGVQVRC